MKIADPWIGAPKAAWLEGQQVVPKRELTLERTKGRRGKTTVWIQAGQTRVYVKGLTRGEAEDLLNRFPQQRRIPFIPEQPKRRLPSRPRPYLAPTYAGPFAHPMLGHEIGPLPMLDEEDNDECWQAKPEHWGGWLLRDFEDRAHEGFGDIG